MLKFSKTTRCGLLFFCVLAIFWCHQTAAAQYRRQKPNPTPTVQPTEKRASVDTKPAAIIDDDDKPSPPVRVASLMLVGNLQHDETYYKGNDVESAQKEFIWFLEFVAKQSAPQMTRGSGKMGYTEAKAEAKKQTDKYVLWMGFSAKHSGLGSMYIDFVQYALIEPVTGKILMRSQIRPGQSSPIGGVMQAPGVRRSSVSLHSEMKDAVRQIAMILRNGGWLG